MMLGRMEWGTRGREVEMVWEMRKRGSLRRWVSAVSEQPRSVNVLIAREVGTELISAGQGDRDECGWRGESAQAEDLEAVYE